MEKWRKNFEEKISDEDNAEKLLCSQFDSLKTEKKSFQSL